MPLNAPVKENTDFEKIKIGTHQMVVSNVYDIGEHLKNDFNTGEPSQKHQCIVLFEVNERITTGKLKGERFVQSRYYNFTMSKKSDLRKLVESLVGATLTDKEAEVFDLEELRGINCSGTISLNTKGKQVLSMISPLMHGIPSIQPELQVEYKPEWIAKLIAEQLPPKNARTHSEDMADDKINTESKLLDDELGQLIFKNEISLGDYKSQIMKVHGKPVDFNQLTDEEALEVYTDLINLAEFKKSRTEQAPRALGSK